jgi:hypothetical protein
MSDGPCCPLRSGLARDSQDVDTRMYGRGDPLAGTLDDPWHRPPLAERDRCCQLPVRFQLANRYFPPGLPEWEPEELFSIMKEVAEASITTYIY